MDKKLLQDFDAEAPIGKTHHEALLAGARLLRLTQRAGAAKRYLLASTVLTSTVMSVHALAHQLQLIPPDNRELLLYLADALLVAHTVAAWSNVGSLQDRLLNYKYQIDKAFGTNPVIRGDGVIIMPPPDASGPEK